MTSRYETEYIGQYEAFVVSRCPIHDREFPFLLASIQSFAACPAYLASFLPPETSILLHHCVHIEVQNLLDGECGSCR